MKKEILQELPGAIFLLLLIALLYIIPSLIF